MIINHTLSLTKHLQDIFEPMTTHKDLRFINIDSNQERCEAMNKFVFQNQELILQSLILSSVSTITVKIRTFLDIYSLV